MERRKVEGVQIDVCGGCQAVWMDPGELQQLLSGNSPSIAEELMGHLLIGKLLDIFEG
jgi:Zn-finger nucleic acid-binding protein